MVFYQQDEEVARVPFVGVEEIEVETIDTAHWIRCKAIDFLKIDAEGMEEMIVEGGLSRIQKDWPLIYVESQPYFQGNDDKFLRRVNGWGYQCVPVESLEMHEILLCIPHARGSEFQTRLAYLFPSNFISGDRSG